MKKVVIIILVTIVVLIVLVSGFFLFFQNQTPEDLSKISDKKIIELLKKNSAALEYIERYKDFKIEKKTALTKDSILEGQNGENFKEVYQGLEMEDNRYLRVDLINSVGSQGLIAVLDFKNKEVPKAFGLILLKSSVKTEK